MFVRMHLYSGTRTVRARDPDRAAAADAATRYRLCTYVRRTPRRYVPRDAGVRARGTYWYGRTDSVGGKRVADIALCGRRWTARRCRVSR